MDNFNKEQSCFCKYCNKECKSLNSLKQHEIRCKFNPNKIDLSYIKGHPNTWSIGRTFIYKDNIHKFINKNDIQKYLSNGWKLGLNNDYKNKISQSLKGKSIGNASTKEKENERKQKISKTMKEHKCGGYRKGSGRGHEGWYNNIFCDSSWELAFLVYYIEHNLYIERCKEKREYIWKEEKHTYIPDFITDKGIIEIKGYQTKQSEEKRKQNPDIINIFKEDIQFYLDYVQNKYNKSLIELYDNSKPNVNFLSNEKYIWMHNENLQKNTMIYPEKYEEYIKNGWKHGRKKFKKKNKKYLN